MAPFRNILLARQYEHDLETVMPRELIGMLHDDPYAPGELEVVHHERDVHFCLVGNTAASGAPSSAGLAGRRPSRISKSATYSRSAASSASWKAS